jgi:hypothetical protein
MEEKKVIRPLTGEGHPSPLLKSGGVTEPVLIADFDPADYPALMMSMRRSDAFVVVQVSESCTRPARCIQMDVHESAEPAGLFKRPQTKTEGISAHLVPISEDYFVSMFGYDSELTFGSFRL